MSTWSILKVLISLLLTLLALAVVSVSAAVAISTTRAEQHENQEHFRYGTANPPTPGSYRGQTTVPLNNWLGKIINPDQQSGINIFTNPENTTQSQRYPFRLTSAKGLRDPTLDVIRLDYNVNPNPWWLRLFIVDEIVQTEPSQYLGKIHLRVLPTLTFTLGYFTLTSEPVK